MLDKIKQMCGIAKEVTVYDNELVGYIADALIDMIHSGVPPDIANENTEDPRVLTAVALYVKTYLANDRTDTDKYQRLYREKVFRMTLEGDDEDVE